MPLKLRICTKEETTAEIFIFIKFLQNSHKESALTEKAVKKMCLSQNIKIWFLKL